MKAAIGGITIFLSLVGYVPYIRDILRGKTKPHAFTWLVWTVVTFIIGFAQLAAGSGWGAVHNIVTGFICLIILFFAFKNKDKDIKKVDIILFVFALLSLPLWFLTKNPTYAIVLITIIDLLAFMPTARKTWNDHSSETLSSYEIAGLKYFLAILAITTYSFATLLYPVALILMNISLVSIIVLRRKKLVARK